MPKAAPFRLLATSAAIFLLTGCKPASSDEGVAPIATQADAEIVLTKAAKAATTRFAADFCFNSALVESSLAEHSNTKLGHWVPTGKQSKEAYRRIAGPSLMTLPTEALAALPKARIDAECRHRISFSRPEFIEVRGLTESYLMATVDLSDGCPTCGSGHSAYFRKGPSGWVMEPKDLIRTWIS